MTVPGGHHAAVAPLPARKLATAAFLGGTIGSMARGGAELGCLALGLPAWGSRVAVNVVGAFLVGRLFASLAARDGAGTPVGIPHSNRMREHLLGAGFLGGFTTVSGMAWDVAAGFLGTGSAGGAATGADPIGVSVIASANAVLGIAMAALGWSCGLAAKRRARPR